METMKPLAAQRFRVWIVTFHDWQPLHWNESPPQATALEPADESLYTAEEAGVFVEGFNSCALGSGQSIWAVAVPVTIRYEGDASPGMPVEGHCFPLAQPATAVPFAAASAAPEAAGSGAVGLATQPLAGDDFHGFGQSPQRSR
jgi:hypothetical protein